MIKLVKNNITIEELNKLQKWLATDPRLTKGVVTEEFENKWSEWLGVKHSCFVNSGSSANLLMMDALIQSNRLKSKKIIVPAVSWVTTVAPVMQLGLTPILCDCDEDDLGLNIDHLQQIVSENEIGAIIIVHVLGVPNKMVEILSICDQYGIILLEDCCESPGSEYNGQKVGTFGLMSSFSFYYGHHISTIEGGMVSTNDLDLHAVVRSIGSHGWARDLPEFHKKGLENKFKIDPFDSLYTFYYPGYNFRSTDLNAFLGISQLEKIDEIVNKRNANYIRYKEKLNDFWNQSNSKSFISNFAFAIISKQRKEIVDKLLLNNVECRPLICGSIGRQPFWINKYGEIGLENADKVHFNGFYIPNNQDLTAKEVDFICDIINSVSIEE